MANNEMSKILEPDEKSKALELQDNLRADKYPLKEYNNIGKRGVRRIDGYEKASGYAEYTIDVQLPGMLHMRFFTSPYPHAEIKSMDTSKAEALPGVRAVLRYDDPELPRLANLGGHFDSEAPVLPKVAHFQGEEVGAVVAADSEEIAEEALTLIDVEWEERPFILDPEEALQPGAPLVNPEEFPDGNLEKKTVEEHGDMEKGFAEADKVIEFKCRRTHNTWIGPERPCGVFRWNGEYPEVWVKQQRPYVAKRVVASWFGGIPMNKIQIHCPYQGASFGGWSQLEWNMGGHYCAAVVAKRVGRPVKWKFNRREDFYGGEMDEGVYYFEVGAKNDGTITAVRAKSVMANQQYPFGPITHFADNTRIPNLYGERLQARVSKGPTTAVRCEQNPNTLPFSLVFGRVAAELGLDPIEVALKNDGCEGEDMAWLDGYKAAMGFPVRDSLRECVEKGKAAIDWDNKWHASGMKKLPNGNMHGMAFTWTHEWDDSAGSSEMAIRIERNDGTASILSCRADCGLNAETAYCQVAADELGMRIEDVFYRQQNDPGFFTMSPDSSTNMSVNGFAIRNAARILKRKILEAATAPKAMSQRGSYAPAFPGMKPEDLDIKDSVIYVKANPSNRMTLAEFVGPSGPAGPMAVYEFGEGAERTAFTPPLFAHGWQVQMGSYKEHHRPRPRLCRQAYFIEIEVDTETGDVEVKNVVTVNDVGKVVNWEGCEGQQYGGAYMGIGRALSEEVIHDPMTGVMLNGNLLNYKFATMLDIESIDTELVETGLGYGPYGVIGIGEDVGTVTPGLLIPAIHNATGKWVDELPATPERVLRALGRA